MKRFFSALILALYASSTLASTLPSTVTTTTTTIPGNSSLIDEITERTLNPNNSSLIDEITVVTQAKNNMKVIPTSQIGITLVKQAELSATASLSGLTMGAAGIAGLAYYQRTGKDPVYAAAASIASAADALFVPAYQAFKATFVSPESYPASAAQYIGEEASVGATIQNIVDSVKNSTSGLYPALESLISNSTLEGYDPTKQTETPVAGVYIDNNGLGWNVSGWEYTGIAYLSYPSSIYASFLNLSIINSSYTGCAANAGRLYTWAYLGPSGSGSAYYIWRNLSPSDTFNPDDPPPLPGSLDFAALKNAFNQANMDASLANDIRTAISALPSDQKITSANPNPTSVPASSPSPITNNDISNFFTANTTNIYNEYLNTVNNGGDVDTAQAAAELAKAQEEEAEKETEEQFNALDANPFQNPYNPGPFDIPTRFTTFLQNVKSSGLFSFSSAFFDSLPGGGSPVYTVNAGHYGTHTIDLSDTMSTGLAVLKSILLACFGFLSIRAVIMKR